MQLPDHLKSKSADELEEWFLGAVSDAPHPVDDLLAVLACLETRGRTARANEWGGMLAETLVGLGDWRSLLALFAQQTGRRGDEAAFREWTKRSLTGAMRGRDMAGFVSASGFDDGVPASECLRRVRTLAELAPEVLCYDGTWGFGIVRRLDSFYGKVTVDFEKKRGHQMTFGYAAEALVRLDDDHLLARRHRDPEGVQALVADRPADVVRIALRSYGPVSVVRLRELLMGSVLADEDWKAFWDRARKELKADPLVVVPGKRTEPIQLLVREREFGAEWFSRLADERDMDRILALLGDLERDGDVSDLAEPFRRTIGERLAFVIRGSEGSRDDVAGLALLAATRLGVPPDCVDPSRVAERFLARDRLLAASASLPARAVGAFFECLMAHHPERMAASLLDALPDLLLTPLGDAIALLVAEGRETACADRLRDLLDRRAGGPIVVYWLCRNLDRVKAWALVSLAELLLQCIEVLEVGASGERLKVCNQVKLLLEQRPWLSGVLAEMSDGERRHYVSRLKTARAWDEKGRRSVLGAVVKLHPELTEMLLEPSSRSARTESTARRLTSWRSYRERQEQLRVLVTQKIPENSRDIGIARSYGDLRENFEYQSAKDQQRLLMQRQVEWDADLKATEPTDFRAAAKDVAGPGTRVVLACPDGTRRAYCVLGEWDRDEALEIISCSSKMAQSVNGHAAGDEVTIPGDGADLVCTIEAVEDLPAPVREWIGTETGD